LVKSNAISGQTSNDIVRQQVRLSPSWFHISGLKEQYKPYIFGNLQCRGFRVQKWCRSTSTSALRKLF